MILKLILSFFTSWNLLLLLSTLFLKYPIFMKKSIYNNVLTNSILGAYICSLPLPPELNKIKTIVYLCNFLFHYLFLFLFFNKFETTQKKKTIIFSMLIGLIYLLFYNPEKVYYFSKFSNIKLITCWIITYMLVFYLN